MIAIYAHEAASKTNLPECSKQVDYCLKNCTGEYSPFMDEEKGENIESDKEYKQLVKAIERGEIEKVMVYSFSSMFNSVSEFSHFMVILNNYNVDFCSVKDDFDTATDSGKTTLTVLMSFANIEKENIAQRIRTNYRKRAQNGVYPGGPAPFGFDITHIDVDGKQVSILQANDRIGIVKTIFDLYSKGNISLGKLAAYLHDEGIKGINRTGWDNVSISRILHNPVYVKADENIYNYFENKNIIIYNDKKSFDGTKGCWLLGKRSKSIKDTDNNDNSDQLLVLACHDGIVDSDEYLKCQERLDSNKRLKKTGNRACTWLAGLVKCGYCGYSMQAVSANGGKYTYLICTGKTNFKVCTTKFRSPHVKDIEPIVAEQLNHRLQQLKDNVHHTELDKDELKKLNAELDDTQTKIATLTDSLANATGVTVSYINKRIADLDDKKSVILKKIKNMIECSRTVELPSENFSTLSFEDKQAVAKLLIKKVVIKSENVDVEWNEI